MTIRDIIDRVDAVRPNVFSEEQKMQWISQLDGKIGANVFLLTVPELRAMEYSYPKDLDSEPLVTSPHDDIYELWLGVKIDYHNGEYNKYNNSLAAYNAAYSEFVRWFADTYEPARGYRY